MTGANTQRWRSQAACRDTPADWWVLDHDAQRRQREGAVSIRIANAKAVCQRCPVVDDCGDWYIMLTATDRHDANAIAGGLTPWERVELVDWVRRVAG
jgi:hypothetical protein